MRKVLFVVATAVAMLGVEIHVSAQATVAGTTPPQARMQVERLGPDLLRIGNVRLDTRKKELDVAGVITDATTLEFIAVVKNGLKAYESALELDTDPISFNTALLLMGLDPSRASRPKFHIDPTPPTGDLVEIWVTWEEGGRERRVRAEDLVYNAQNKSTLSTGPWVYTGSAFAADGGRYLAELEGTLIGFVHSPAPVIDSPRPLAPGEYGSNRLNPALGLEPGQAVTLIVKALPAAKP